MTMPILKWRQELYSEKWRQAYAKFSVGIHLDLTSVYQAGKSVGVHPFLPIRKGVVILTVVYTSLCHYYFLVQ